MAEDMKTVMRLFFEVASPLTIASLMVDLQNSEEWTDEIDTLHELLRESLIAIVGEDEAAEMCQRAGGYVTVPPEASAPIIGVYEMADAVVTHRAISAGDDDEKAAGELCGIIEQICQYESHCSDCGAPRGMTGCGGCATCQPQELSVP